MILSNRNGLKNTRNMLRVFGGLNETYSCTEAEYSAGINFSARNFPALSTRTPRRKLREVENLNGTIKLLKEQIDSLNAQIIRLDSNLKDKDAIIELLKEKRQ